MELGRISVTAGTLQGVTFAYLLTFLHEMSMGSVGGWESPKLLLIWALTGFLVKSFHDCSVTQAILFFTFGGKQLSLQHVYWTYFAYIYQRGFPVGASSKNPPANAGDMRCNLIPGSGGSPGEGQGNLLQYSCLENPMDRGAWWSALHRSKRVEHNWSDLTYMYIFTKQKHCFQGLDLNKKNDVPIKQVI